MAPGNRTLFLNGRIPRRFGNSTDSVILQQLGTRSENRTSKTASVVCLIEVKSTYFFFLKKRISFDNYIKRRRRRKVKQESKSQRWGEGLFVGRWIWFGLVWFGWTKSELKSRCPNSLPSPISLPRSLSSNFSYCAPSEFTSVSYLLCFVRFCFWIFWKWTGDFEYYFK